MRIFLLKHRCPWRLVVLQFFIVSFLNVYFRRNFTRIQVNKMLRKNPDINYLMFKSYTQYWCSLLTFMIEKKLYCTAAIPKYSVPVPVPHVYCTGTVCSMCVGSYGLRYLPGVQTRMLQLCTRFHSNLRSLPPITRPALSSWCWPTRRSVSKILTINEQS